MRTHLIAVACVGALSGCGQTGEYASEDAADPVMMEIAPAAGAAASAGQPSGTAPVPAIPARIAYTYRYTLSLPTERALSLMARHEQACIEAGPTVCQVLGATSIRHGQDTLSARLELRATPTWIAGFRRGVGEQAEEAGGRVASSSTESEDLTRQLTDTDARLNALTTLRDRLQQLLANRSGPLEQLLEVERELARVQGELDGTRSALETMRTRVATSRLTVNYQSAGQLAPDSAWRPISNALSNALTAFTSTLGALILIVAGLLPIALVAIPLVWLGLKWRARRNQKTLAKPKRAKTDQP